MSHGAARGQPERVGRAPTLRRAATSPERPGDWRGSSLPLPEGFLHTVTPTGHHLAVIIVPQESSTWPFLTDGRQTGRTAALKHSTVAAAEGPRNSRAFVQLLSLSQKGSRRRRRQQNKRKRMAPCDGEASQHRSTGLLAQEEGLLLTHHTCLWSDSSGTFCQLCTACYSQHAA